MTHHPYLPIHAFQVAESLNIKKIKSDFKASIFFGSNSELFYYFEDRERYLYIFNYGVIVFCNYDEVSESEFLRFVQPFSEKWIEAHISEEYEIRLESEQKRASVKNDYVALSAAGYRAEEAMICMLNTGQSVALEYYESLTDAMIEKTKVYTEQLEKEGKLKISKKAALQHIGSVLNVKNSVVDNLYILDDPAIVWDDEDLAYLNRNLKSNFDINSRFKDLDYRLKIVEDNLKLFTELLQHKESARLEWIVIILILVEALSALFRK